MYKKVIIQILIVFFSTYQAHPLQAMPPKKWVKKVNNTNRKEEEKKEEEKAETQKKEEKKSNNNNNNSKQAEEDNLTKEALKEEEKFGEYTSKAGLIYKRFGTIEEKTRVAHITRHCEKNENEEKFIFFDSETEACKDVVRFIDKIYEQLKTRKILEETKSATGYMAKLAGKVILDEKEYSVMCNFNSSQYFYIMQPAEQNNNLNNDVYPVTGEEGGSNNPLK